MSDETPKALTFKELQIGVRFSFEGRNYTKSSYNKARYDERRDGDGPTRFRDEDEVEPEIKATHSNSAPHKAADEPAKQPAKPTQKPNFKAEPLPQEPAKQPAKTEETKK